MSIVKNYAWPTVRLGDHVDLLAGYAFKSSGFTDNPDDIPLVKGDNVQQGFIDWNRAKRWPREQFKEMSKFSLRAGDVVLAMDRPWVEAGLKLAWVKPNDPPALLVQRVSRIRGINSLSTPYMRYVLCNKAFTDYIRPIVTGINVPHISPSQIQDYTFKLPPQGIQRRIASILSAYDDLIENNTRRIAILEEIARRIYEEWFVRFRFPGHEQVKMMESELGMIPEGWQVQTVADFGKVITGKTPSKSDPENFGDDVPFIKTPDMHGNLFCISTGEGLSAKGAESQKGKTLPENSLCVSCIGTAGVVSITTRPAQTNQQINAVVLNEQHNREFLYFALVGLKETINLYGANGATMVNLNKSKFEGLKIVYGDSPTVDHYHTLAFSFFEEIRVLQLKNANLRATRDLLLPKLMSGELDVSTLPEPEEVITA